MKKFAFLALALVVLLSGCGSSNELEAAHSAGFFNGLWDGITAPFAFMGNLFGLGDWNIYEVHNTGGWYNFGFILGIGGILSGGGAEAAS